MTGPKQPAPIREQIEQLRATRGTSAPRMVRELRAHAPVDQFADRPDTEHPLAVSTRMGEVRFARVEFRQIDSDTAVTEVWVGESGDGPPHYRFFNPPTLAQDSQGDIEIEGQRYREDPLAAIAEVILGGKR